MTRTAEESAIWIKADDGGSRASPSVLSPNSQGPWNSYSVLEIGSGSSWLPYRSTAGALS